MDKPIRVRCTDKLGNVAYIIRRPNGSVQCALSNGTNAALSYGGISDEMPARFAIEDAETPEQVLAACIRYGYPGSTYVLV